MILLAKFLHQKYFIKNAVRLSPPYISATKTILKRYMFVHVCTNAARNVE